jgi:signal transduction histidine kinase
MPLQFKIPAKNYFYLIAVFSIGIILASIGLALYTITDNYRLLSYLDGAYGINNKIDRIYYLLKDEENQQRGYLITNKPVFLRTASYTEKILKQEYEDIYAVLKNEPDLRDHLIAFKFEVEMKMLAMKNGMLYIDLANRNADSLDYYFEKGEVIMARIRETIGKIKKIEYARFSKIREQMFSKSELSIFIIALTSGISILLLISILFRLKRAHDSRMIIEMELSASQKRLKQQVEMLNSSNKELEHFAYIASHDLEEPLRKINSFSEKIQLKLGNTADEEVSDSLKRLKNSVERMRIFINDLLNYSRVTRMLDINETVDLNVVFKTILDDFEMQLDSKKAIVSVQHLDAVRGNNTQLRQLFQNLISNALKFSEKVSPRIEVTAMYLNETKITATRWGENLHIKRGKYYCIFVKDDGIGFESQYLKQIFIIFQRLHGRSEYKGTGIGLAICKRIVENHGGAITAESEVGKGTTFIVALPVK